MHLSIDILRVTDTMGTTSCKMQAFEGVLELSFPQLLRQVTPSLNYLASMLRYFDTECTVGLMSAHVVFVGWPHGVVQVPDTLVALQDLASDVRTRFKGNVVAITGSCGKTTTREMVRARIVLHVAT
jgi:UDP-N-acetylmuramyl pentapeptide synthase